MRVAVVAIASAAVLGGACGAQRDHSNRGSLDAAAIAYVRLVLALGERDSDSLDSYHGPPAWRAEAHAERATLAHIRDAAVALAGSLKTPPPDGHENDEQRRAFLIRQLHAVASRIDILQGA